MILTLTSTGVYLWVFVLVIVGETGLSGDTRLNRERATCDVLCRVLTLVCTLDFNSVWVFRDWTVSCIAAVFVLVNDTLRVSITGITLVESPVNSFVGAYLV